MADKRREVERSRQKREVVEVGRENAGASRSVLEQSSLDELLATVELRKAAYLAAYGEAEEVEGPVLVSSEPIAVAERAAAEKRDMLSIPRRPPWREGMTVEELAVLENEAFLDWRRHLAEHAAEGGLHLTPYEKNLDFWRQLWRCVERSDLVVQILDARDPDFYRCPDLARYVAEAGDGSKRLALLVNKADFLTTEQRSRWAEYFKSNNVDVVFFSALREVQRQQPHQQNRGPGAARLAPGAEAAGESDGEDNAAEEAVLGPSQEDAPDIADCHQLLATLRSWLPDGETSDVATRRRTVGFVGYPNVGKSTVINALVGAKKVGMSRTPGKTKHIQTLELPEFGITLCDCPGLVFPSVVATRAHLVINNTVPLEDLRDAFGPVALIVEKMGFQRCLDSYACGAYVEDAAKRSGSHKLDEAHSFLAAFAVARNHFLRVGVPDENWAARKVLRDYCRGQLLYCEPPPPAAGAEAPAVGGAAAAEAPAAALERSGAAETPAAGSEAAAAAVASTQGEDDFDDLDDFIKEQAGQRTRRMTKRKERAIHKQIQRGKQPAVSPGMAGYVGGGKLML